MAASKAFVSGVRSLPARGAARPVQPHRAQKKGKRAMDEFLEELKARDGLRDRGFTLIGAATYNLLQQKGDQVRRTRDKQHGLP